MAEKSLDFYSSPELSSSEGKLGKAPWLDACQKKEALAFVQQLQNESPDFWHYLLTGEDEVRPSQFLQDLSEVVSPHLLIELEEGRRKLHAMLEAVVGEGPLAKKGLTVGLSHLRSYLMDWSGYQQYLKHSPTLSGDHYFDFWTESIPVHLLEQQEFVLSLELFSERHAQLLSDPDIQRVFAGSFLEARVRLARLRSAASIIKDTHPKKRAEMFSRLGSDRTGVTTIQASPMDVARGLEENRFFLNANIDPEKFSHLLEALRGFGLHFELEGSGLSYRVLNTEPFPSELIPTYTAQADAILRYMTDRKDVLTDAERKNLELLAYLISPNAFYPHGIAKTADVSSETILALAQETEYIKAFFTFDELRAACKSLDLMIRAIKKVAFRNEIVVGESYESVFLANLANISSVIGRDATSLILFDLI